MTTRPPHDDTLGDDCECFRCCVRSLQLSRKPQTTRAFRPVEQPPSSYGTSFTVERPGGGRVPIAKSDGRFVTVREAATSHRHFVDQAIRKMSQTPTE